MPTVQRKVSKNLGKNITYEHENIYNKIESKIGQMKSCTFGHIRGSKTGVKHDGDKYRPIRDFELRGCIINDLHEVVITGDGLQSFCRECSRKRRKKRIEMSREKNKGGYDTYEKEYGSITKCCSMCNENKIIRDFKLSPGMECGIHNICIECSINYGDSMGNRLIKYRPDGNYKYKKTRKNYHDDHIIPLMYGGTNEKINHQLITATENLTKSSTIPFENVSDILPSFLSERWRPILIKSQQENVSIGLLKSRLAYAISEEQKQIYSMEDYEIEKIYKEYNKKYNRRINTKRCVDKFKIYCKNIKNYKIYPEIFSE